MTTYSIEDPDTYSEGGSAEFYYVKEHPYLGFKQFKNKKWALDAHKRQKRLAKFDLAPKVYTSVKRLKTSWYSASGWGFVTEKALILDDNVMSKRLKQIQDLVDLIYEKTGWKFWDCHYHNIGYIKRNNKTKLVCIDTGSESFLRDYNAWGFGFPGPKCNRCDSYQCSC